VKVKSIIKEDILAKAIKNKKILVLTPDVLRTLLLPIMIRVIRVKKLVSGVLLVRIKPFLKRRF